MENKQKERTLAEYWAKKGLLKPLNDFPLENRQTLSSELGGSCGSRALRWPDLNSYPTFLYKAPIIYSTVYQDDGLQWMATTPGQREGGTA